MPKENTHIYFAESLRSRLPENITLLLSNHREAYYLGSFAPDILFYSPNTKITPIPSVLHGIDGEPTNRLIFAMLKAAQNERDLACIMGYIAHCALDIVFHPVVYYISGNSHSEDPVQNERAQYKHLYLETRLDIFIKSPLMIYSVIKPEFLKGLVLEKVLCESFKDFSLTRADIRKALKRQLLFYRVFAINISHFFAKFLFKEKFKTALFYGCVTDPMKSLDESIEYRDILSGKPLKTTYTKLFNQASLKGMEMIKAAYRYYQGTIGDDELEKAIPGESLDTGQVGIPVIKIKYTSTPV
ncbi:MAG: zinc dependent phospholipase C family protein [bacterium]|nr:zinc dependent phospholipase C family protein [bacterium]